MTTVAVPATLAELLEKANGPVSLVTEQGRLLGSFSPAAVRHADGRIIGSAKADNPTPKEPLFTPEEIAEAECRIDSLGPWYTTKEVLEHLKSLDQA